MLGEEYIDFNCTINTKQYHWSCHQSYHWQMGLIPIFQVATTATMLSLGVNKYVLLKEMQFSKKIKDDEI